MARPFNRVQLYFGGGCIVSNLLVTEYPAPFVFL